MRTSLSSFFKDKNGRIVIWQSPNILLGLWLLFKVITFLLSEGKLQTGFDQLSTALLFAWACYEAAKGVNYFRKSLGLIVLAFIIYGFFT